MDQDFLKLILNIAERMTESGAEINRVEESVTRICKAYGCRHVDIYATTANIIVTVETAERVSLTQHRRISGTGTDIDKLDRLNDLVRHVAEETPPAEEIRAKFKEIEGRQKAPLPITVLCYGVISASFCIFFGSRSVAEFLSAGAIGILTGLLSVLFEKCKFNKILARFLCSFTAALVVKLLLSFGAIDFPDYIIIGIIMTLIPGVGFTNALRDLFMGDMVTGTLRSIEALLLAVAIAIGFALPNLITGGAL